MKESTPKEQILTKVRNALIDKRENPYQNVDVSVRVLKTNEEDDPEVQFAKELIHAGGLFVYCENEQEFVNNLSDLIDEMQWSSLWCQNQSLESLLSTAEIPFFKEAAGDESPLVSLTACESLIASTGTIVVSDSNAGSREIFSLPDIHLVLAYSSQVRATIKDVMRELKLKYTNGLPPQLSFITGNSRTADIEKTLVHGAHGPKSVYLFLIDDL